MGTKAPLESLWSVVFGTPDGPDGPDYGAGIIVLDTGRVMGGDRGYYYLGRYTIDGGKININVNVKRHTDMTSSIFG